jgi:hypothetical protein
MRTRGIKFWRGRIETELEKSEEKRFSTQSSIPRNQTEADYFEIALYMIEKGDQKLVA